jgi:hypothetical protein
MNEAELEDELEGINNEDEGSSVILKQGNSLDHIDESD